MFLYADIDLWFFSGAIPGEREDSKTPLAEVPCSILRNLAKLREQ